jgi:hypothetical protein
MNRMFLAAACAGLALAACSHQGLFRSEDELSQKTRPAQATIVPATVSRATVLRAGPDRASTAVAELPGGAQVTAADAAARGFRRVKTADGRSGYVEDGALRAGAAEASGPASGGSAGGSGGGSVR